MQIDQADAEMMQYMIKHQQRFKTLLKPIKDDAGELLNNSFTAMDFIDRAKWIVITDICLSLSLGVDKVAEFVNKVNVGELLK